jgi:alpha-D-xyloside xylohydrolase
MFTSHSRVHGFPPREPWEFSDDFLKVFRQMVEMRYKLMPYIFTQAAIASQNGWPMLKAMFLNYPDDPTTWNLEDQFMFGEDMLIAPILEENTVARNVYLTKGKWINYQTKEVYEGSRWIKISVDEIPGIIMVKMGSIIPHIELAQSTAFMDWSKIELVVFDEENKNHKGSFYLPNGNLIDFEITSGKKPKVNSSGKNKPKLTVTRFDN